MFFNNIRKDLFDKKDKDVEVKKIFDKLSMTSQKNKIMQKGLKESEAELEIKLIRRRFHVLYELCKYYDVKNIAEVGTANGCQFFTFAEYLKNHQKNDCHVYSCDIVDIVDREYYEKYKDISSFTLGDSKKLSKNINKEIGLFFIDGAHDPGSVFYDILNLKKHQSEKCIWIFDDFDERFGSCIDLKIITNSNHFAGLEKVKYQVTQDNNMLVLVGAL